jgi:protein SCO1/2
MARQWQTISPREQIRRRYFPDMRLTTDEGKSVRLYEDLIEDKIVVLNFMYARCRGVCIPVTSNLLRVQKLLGDRVGRDIFMYSFTLDPLQDTPEVLRDYARRHAVRPGWTFLTGAPADLELLRRRLGFVDPDPTRDADRSNHTGMVRYGNEPLHLWAAFAGMSKAEAIAKEILWVDWPGGGDEPA